MLVFFCHKDITNSFVESSCARRPSYQLMMTYLLNISSHWYVIFVAFKFFYDLFWCMQNKPVKLDRMTELVAGYESVTTFKQ